MLPFWPLVRAVMPVRRMLWIGSVALWGWGCRDDAPHRKSAPSTEDSAAPEDSDLPGDSADTTDSGDTADTEEPAAELYCRSLDPTWADAYTDELDQPLAELIDIAGLLGDPTLYVDEDGGCRQRTLPDIADPLPQLGRALFFSLDLSGDGDVACATCHHPALGGADALSLPLGVGFEATLVGADRASGLTDVERIRTARNSPSVLNVALWDHRLMWDGRVEASDPEAGFNGERGGITVPGGTSDAPDLVAAQALMPIGHPDEMAGSLADGSEEAVTVIVDRLAEDSHWQAAFAEACDSSFLSEGWQTACDDPSLPLVEPPLLADALSAYQRSLVFVDSPWSAYVQGDLDAISDAAKQGALAFYRSPAEGGLNCGACHTGDFFTDEQLHAIAAPQIGPGNPIGTGTPGLDLGRAELSGSDDDAFAFRTPTLLNVSQSAPYFHAGSVPTLFRVVLHYRGVDDSLAQSFGFAGEPLRRAPAWCTAGPFAEIDDCEELYTADATHDGDLTDGVDGELEGIENSLDLSSDLMVLFLESLTDPRLNQPAALSPWIIDGATAPTPTATSNPWPDRCQVTVEWSQELDLRMKGMRWLVKRTRPAGMSLSTNVRPSTVFGREYWNLFGRRYAQITGLTRAPASTAAGVLALLTNEQQSALFTAYRDESWAPSQQTYRSQRDAVGALIDDWRDSGSAVEEPALLSAIQQLHIAESTSTLAIAQAYGEAWQPLSPSERDAHAAELRRFLGGDLSMLPAELSDPELDTLSLPDGVADTLSAYGLTYDNRLADFILSYATWTAGPDCVDAFVPRQDLEATASGWYGFASWVDSALFNLDNGIQEPATAQQELATLVASLEQDAGYTAMTTALVDTNIAKRTWLSALEETSAATRAVGEAVASGTPPPETRLTDAYAALAVAEAALSSAELDYYFGLRDSLGAERLDDIEHWIDCLESPETQAMKNNGGFDALGGGSCLPPE